MKHGRVEPYEDVFPWTVCHDGWRRCHAQMVWQAIQAVVLAGLLKEANKRDEDGGPWLVYSRGCDKANWEP